MNMEDANQKHGLFRRQRNLLANLTTTCAAADAAMTEERPDVAIMTSVVAADPTTTTASPFNPVQVFSNEELMDMGVHYPEESKALLRRITRGGISSEQLDIVREDEQAFSYSSASFRNVTNSCSDINSCNKANHAVIVKSLIWAVSIDDDNDDDDDTILSQSNGGIQYKKYVCTVLDAGSKVNKRALSNYLLQNIHSVLKTKELSVSDDNINEMILPGSSSIKVNVQLATPEEAEQYSGFKIGSIPPIGHASSLPVLLDESLLPSSRHQSASPFYVLGGCGIVGSSKIGTYHLRISLSELLKYDCDGARVFLAPVSRQTQKQEQTQEQTQQLSSKSYIKGDFSSLRNTNNNRSTFAVDRRTVKERLWTAVGRRDGFDQTRNLLEGLNKDQFMKAMWKDDENGSSDVKMNWGGGKNILHRGKWDSKQISSEPPSFQN